MELFQRCPPSGKDKYPTWQYWQFPAKELLCLLVWSVGFHSHIINFYHTCIEYSWHIKQLLYKKKLQPSACIWVAPDLIADWKYLGKKPFVTRGENYELIYFLENIYKKKSPLKNEKYIYIYFLQLSFSHYSNFWLQNRKPSKHRATSVDPTGTSGLMTWWLFLMIPYCR